MSKKIVRNVISKTLQTFGISFSYRIPQLFSLQLKQEENVVFIVMELLIKEINTSDFPKTVSIIKHSLPSLLRAECFNEENLPFHKEIEETEIGHLFEHVMLEYLCIFKLSKGCQFAEYTGETDWDWGKEKKGVFNIKIGINFKDSDILLRSLEKSTDLLKLILESNKSERVGQYFPAGTYLNPQQLT